MVWCVSGFRSRPGPVQTPNPLTVTYLLPSLLSSYPSFFSFLSLSAHCTTSLLSLPFFSFMSFCPPSLSLTTSPPPLHPLFAPPCPTVVSAAGAVDSVVVSALRHNLRLLGGAGSPVALQGRHSVPAHYRHNLLLSPVSKPRKPPPK